MDQDDIAPHGYKTGSRTILPKGVPEKNVIHKTHDKSTVLEDGTHDFDAHHSKPELAPRAERQKNTAMHIAQHPDAHSDFIHSDHERFEVDSDLEMEPSHEQHKPAPRSEKTKIDSQEQMLARYGGAERSNPKMPTVAPINQPPGAQCEHTIHEVDHYHVNEDRELHPAEWDHETNQVRRLGPPALLSPDGEHDGHPAGWRSVGGDVGAGAGGSTPSPGVLGASKEDWDDLRPPS